MVLHFGGIMHKKHKWISILLPEEVHKELTIMALNEGVNLGLIGKIIIAEFTKDKKWQSRVISKISE